MSNSNRTAAVTAQTFWDVASPLIAVTEKHPFLVSMVDGTLAEENFKYYVVQDALYLKDFADCLRRVADKAPSPADSARLVNFAKGAEECEMELHNSFFKQWNISSPGGTGEGAEDEAQQMPNCLLYTSYMKRVVATESYAQGLAVLLPCFWVYMHVGHVMLKLRKDLANSVNRKPQYDAWIDMYAGEDFEKEVKDFIAMVNAECQRIQEKGLDADEDTAEGSSAADAFKRMQHHFSMGCKLEHMFWDQASTMMQWPKISGM
ncbi:unnamed protein product [Pseudo-nitzschia multistriata]|uniref:Thiaminase-2/PQQC domain-containing protein n=1 Tax=Pseudo-nitzschia multistriata TaxID=183589 RepID=A0A448ZNF2_9STRA|nr:unnamed protein product [Pseudo-nitzschia multistriata]